MLFNMKTAHWMPLRKFLVLALLSACAHGPLDTTKAPPKLSSVGDKEAVLVLFMSDLHSQLRAGEGGRGGYAQLKKWVDSEKARAGLRTDVIVIGGGDLFGKGSLPCQETKDKDCAPLLRDIGLNYSTLGNYELYNSSADLARLIQSTGASFFGMNVVPKKGTSSWSTSPIKIKGVKSGLEFWLASWTAPLDVKDYSIRPTPSAHEWSSWKRQWAAPVLWVTHQELAKDLAFLNQACAALGPQVQVLALLKANDHRSMQQDRSACAPLLEPGPFGQTGLKLLLTRDAQNPHRLKVDSEFVSISGFGEDVAIKARIDALYQKYAPDADQVVFTADTEISKETLSAWVAEAFHKRMKADAAISNLGFVKSGLPAGPVTREQLTLALPHKNELMGLDWPVKDLEKALCAASMRKRDSELDHGSELSFSGFTLENPGTPQCKIPTNKRSFKIVVDEYLVSRSERWLGRSIASRSFRFGVDSRRAVTLQLQIQKPTGAR